MAIRINFLSIECLLIIFFALCIFSCATPMVGGSVNTVDINSKTFSIITPMNQKEIIRINEETIVTRAGVRRSIEDLQTGDNLKIYYETKPDGTVIAKSIIIGEVVPRCSCGISCPCPLSRGCKIIRY